MKQSRALSALSLIVLPALVHAHCGCNDASAVCLCPTTAATNRVGALSLGVVETITDYERVVGKGTEAHGDTFDLRSYTTQITLGYQASERLRLQVNVPVLMRETSGAAAPPTDDGLGDVSVFGVWRVKQAKNGRLDLFAGLEAPTGDTDGLKGEVHAAEAVAATTDDPADHDHAGLVLAGHAGEDHGEEAHTPTPVVAATPTSSIAQEMSLGSGSWDVILGAAGHFQTGGISWLADAAYRLNNEGDHNYEFGDEILWRAGPFVPVCPAAEVGVEVSGVHRERDTRSGVDVDVSGSDWIFVGPTVHTRTQSGWFGTLGLDLPVERDVNKQQMAPEWRGRLSVAKAF